MPAVFGPKANLITKLVLRGGGAGLLTLRAYMTFHVAEDGTALVSRNYDTPVKNTDVTVGRLEDLTPEVVSVAIDDFLLRALNP
ncbi:hypothetical protein GGE65_001272 [Skermanella aerolata]|uniref:hypothetical protein n=1 Tax=Skermanella aerolata TaxID=393310 RepID=UPI003D1FED09